MKANLFILLFFITSLQSNSQNIEKLLGQWTGKIEKEKQWAVEIDFYLSDNGLTASISYPDYGLYNYITDSLTVTDTSVNIIYTSKTSPFEFIGLRKKNSVEGYWKGLNQSGLFSLAKRSKQYFPLREQEVIFRNADAILKGTLILPEEKGPYPAVVQVHGSGNQTRSEDFYRSRAFMLARNGIAVLIYDRRGKGQSTGESVTMDLLAADAIAAVHYLQNSQWIDKNKIGVMGFSQGGYVAPLAASRSQAIAFIIAGAAPAITPDEQNDFNALNRLQNIGMSKDSIDDIIKFRKEITNYQFYGKGNKQELELKLTGLQKEKWFQQTLLPVPPIGIYDSSVVRFLKFDPLIAWRQVKIPTLLVWGEMDQLVPVEKSKTEITNALNTAGNKNFQTKIFPGSGHGLAQVSKTKADWPRLADGYHSLLVAWIKESIK